MTQTTPAPDTQIYRDLLNEIHLRAYVLRDHFDYLLMSIEPLSPQVGISIDLLEHFTLFLDDFEKRAFSTPPVPPRY